MLAALRRSNSGPPSGAGAPRVVGAKRQARRHGYGPRLRNCSETFGLAVPVGRRCSCRLHSFPQLDKLFPQIPERLLTNALGCAILLLHPNRKVPAERQTESARERCSGFVLRRDSEKPVKLQLGGLFLCFRLRSHFRASVEQDATRRLAMACGRVCSPPSAPPWGRVRRGGGVDDWGQDNLARSAWTLLD